MPEHFGLWIVAAGVVLVVAGLLVWGGGLNWFGHLPGDIRIERGSTRILVPITSMLLISIVLTVLVNLARRLF